MEEQLPSFIIFFRFFSPFVNTKIEERERERGRRYKSIPYERSHRIFEHLQESVIVISIIVIEHAARWRRITETSSKSQANLKNLKCFWAADVGVINQVA